MTKIITLIFFMVSFSLFAKNHKVKICGHQYYPPVMFKEKGKVLGTASILVTQILKGKGHNVVNEYSGNWKRCIHDLTTGNIDIVVAAYETPKRSESISFIRPSIMDDPLKVFVHKDKKFKLTKITDLLGKKTMSILGDTRGEYLDRFINENFKQDIVKDKSQVLDSLMRKRSDFFIGGLYSTSILIKKNKLSKDILPLELEIKSQKLYVGVSKKSIIHDKLITMLKNGITGLKKKNEISKLTKEAYESFMLK